MAKKFQPSDKQLKDGIGTSELAELVTVADQDFAKAKQAWKKNPPSVEYTNLIDPEIDNNS